MLIIINSFTLSEHDLYLFPFDLINEHDSITISVIIQTGYEW